MSIPLNLMPGDVPEIIVADGETWMRALRPAWSGPSNGEDVFYLSTTGITAQVTLFRDEDRALYALVGSMRRDGVPDERAWITHAGDLAAALPNGSVMPRVAA